MRKILLVEDDALLNRTLTYNLTEEGYQVTPASRYREAVQHIQATEFDLALLDVNLPDGSGLDLCQEIRGRGRGLCHQALLPAGAVPEDRRRL